MTRYQPKETHGCVVHDINAWVHGSTPPARIALDNIRNLHMDMQSHEVFLTDLNGDEICVIPGDVVIDTPNGGLGWMLLEEFEDKYVVSPE